MSATVLKMILLIGIAITLAGCQATMPTKPTKPTLDVIEKGDLICFSKPDAVALGGYILELERGY